MKSLVFSPAAHADIEGIYDYTIERWGIEQAENYVTELHNTCQNIASDEKKGRDASYIRSGYSQQTSGSHFIFFRVTEPKTIEIMRILHQKMNFEAHL